MRIAICDDDAIYRTQILDFTEDYKDERKDKKIDFEIFSDSKSLLEANRTNGGFDIYILDIVMPDMNGIELGSVLRDEGIDGKIIYLTSSKEFALDSFRVRPFDYILKPITREAFYKTMDEAINTINIKQDKSSVIKTKDGIARVAFDSILYVESSNRALLYHLKNGKFLETSSLRSSFAVAVSELLTDKRFALCGVSTVVNLNYITSIENESVIFQDKERIFINKKLCRELRNTWSDFLFNEVNDL